MTRVPPKFFTEKGLYMLATILKSPVATQTTIAIVEAFANMRELSRTINHLSETQDKTHQKSLMKMKEHIFIQSPATRNDNLQAPLAPYSIEKR